MSARGNSGPLGVPGIAGRQPQPFVNSATASAYQSSSSIAVTVPSGWVPGDLALLFVGGDYSTSGTPSGWTLVGATSGTNHNATMYYKILTAGDLGASVTVNMGGSSAVVAHMISISNFNAFLSSGVSQDASGTNPHAGPAPAFLAKDALMVEFASARIGSKALTTTLAGSTLVIGRSSDASNSSALWQAKCDGSSMTSSIDATTSTSGWGFGYAAVT